MKFCEKNYFASLLIISIMLFITLTTMVTLAFDGTTGWFGSTSEDTRDFPYFSHFGYDVSNDYTTYMDYGGGYEDAYSTTDYGMSYFYSITDSPEDDGYYYVTLTGTIYTYFWHGFLQNIESPSTVAIYLDIQDYNGEWETIETESVVLLDIDESEDWYFDIFFDMQTDEVYLYASHDYRVRIRYNLYITGDNQYDEEKVFAKPNMGDCFNALGYCWDPEMDLNGIYFTQS